MTTALLACVAALVSGAPAAQAAAHSKVPATHARRQETQRVFVAVMDGAYEVPADLSRATGTAELRLRGSRLYYDVRVDSIADVRGVSIHIGQARTEGPAVARLFEGDRTGSVNGLRVSGTLEPKELHGATMAAFTRALRADDVYVTITTRSHPQGEVRGQLRAQPAEAGA